MFTCFGDMRIRRISINDKHTQNENILESGKYSDRQKVGSIWNFLRACFIYVFL